MSKHTPGPWTQRAYRLDEIVALSTSKDSLQTIAYAERLLGRHNEAVANARLIAAAPDLLDALRELLAEASEGISTSPLTRDAARAAILKATGDD